MLGDRFRIPVLFITVIFIPSAATFKSSAIICNSGTRLKCVCGIKAPERQIDPLPRNCEDLLNPPNMTVFTLTIGNFTLDARLVNDVRNEDWFKRKFTTLILDHCYKYEDSCKDVDEITKITHSNVVILGVETLPLTLASRLQLIITQPSFKIGNLESDQSNIIKQSYTISPKDIARLARATKIRLSRYLGNKPVSSIREHAFVSKAPEKTKDNWMDKILSYANVPGWLENDNALWTLLIIAILIAIGICMCLVYCVSVYRALKDRKQHKKELAIKKQLQDQQQRMSTTQPLLEHNLPKVSRVVQRDDASYISFGGIPPANNAERLFDNAAEMPELPLADNAILLPDVDQNISVPKNHLPMCSSNRRFPRSVTVNGILFASCKETLISTLTPSPSLDRSTNFRHSLRSIFNAKSIPKTENKIATSASVYENIMPNAASKFGEKEGNKDKSSEGRDSGNPETDLYSMINKRNSNEIQRSPAVKFTGIAVSRFEDAKTNTPLKAVVDNAIKDATPPSSDYGTFHGSMAKEPNNYHVTSLLRNKNSTSTISPEVRVSMAESLASTSSSSSGISDAKLSSDNRDTLPSFRHQRFSDKDRSCSVETSFSELNDATETTLASFSLHLHSKPIDQNFEKRRTNTENVLDNNSISKIKPETSNSIDENMDTSESSTDAENEPKSDVIDIVPRETTKCNDQFIRNCGKVPPLTENTVATDKRNSQLSISSLNSSERSLNFDDPQPVSQIDDSSSEGGEEDEEERVSNEEQFGGAPKLLSPPTDRASNPTGFTKYKYSRLTESALSINTINLGARQT